MAEKFEIRKTWRVKKFHKAPPPPKVLGPVPADDIEPTRIFDQLSAIGDTFVWCFVLETTEGLILIDNLYPYPKYIELVEDGLRKLGLDPSVIRRVSVCMYEGEINMVIHANGGTAKVDVGLDDITITLTDRGPGIPDIEKAMQAGFTTAGDSVRDLGFGAGMGLPNMKKYSDEMTVESAVGVGTTVTMVVRIE